MTISTYEGEQRGSSGSCSYLSSLSLATALGGNVAAATAATGSETSTAVALEATTALAAGTVTTTTAGATASGEAVTAEGVATGAALLNEDLLAANLVGVGGNSSSVARGLLELNESAVLHELVYINKMQLKDCTNLGAADVEVLQLAETGQSLLKQAGVDLLVDILDISKGGLLLASTGLGLLVVMASGLPSRISGASLLGTGSLGGGGSSSGLSSGSLSSGSGSLGSSRGSRGRGGGSRSSSLGGALASECDAGPSLGNSRGGGSVLLGNLFLLGNGRRLRSGRLLIVYDLSFDGGSGSGSGGLLNSRDTVGLRGRLSGLLNLSVGLSLLKLLINLGGSHFVGHLGLLNGSLDGLGGLGSRRSRGGGLSSDLLLFINHVTEDVVENIVTIGLLSENKGLHELAGGLGLVGDLANNGDQDVVERGLRVDVQDAHLALLEVQLLNLIVDSLVRGIC
jgi:hypothetical protein